MILESIHIYPVKGLRGISMPAATVEPCGLQGDRRWMVVDPAGRYLTQRDLPGMARILATPAGEGAMDGAIILTADGTEPLHVPVPDATAPAAIRPAPVRIWRDHVPACSAGGDAAAWLTSALGRPCHLVHLSDPAARPVDPAYGHPGDRVSFADGFPLLVVNTASLDDLNARLAQPVPITRFRSNLVVSGAAPWAEDGWQRLRVGRIAFRAVKPCTRCSVITTDQDTGARAPDREPLRTLATLRPDAGGRALFGQNLVPDTLGRLAVGMPVATQPGAG